VQASGHWTYYKVLDQKVSCNYFEAHLNGESYKAFVKGDAIVRYVMGEFFWRVRQGERTSVADYVAPPNILSFEKRDEESRVAHGVYVPVHEVETAFGLKNNLPRTFGVAPNQLPPYHFKLAKIWAIAGYAVAAAFFVQIVSSVRSENANVQEFEIVASTQADAPTQASPVFSIPKAGNVLIESFAPVSNNWLELNLSLVNEQTNVEYNLTQAIEYYFGSTDGGWTEGSKNTYAYVSSVPAGTYKILVDATQGRTVNNTTILKRASGSNSSLSVPKKELDENLLVKISVKRDVPSFMNFIWLLFPLLLIPFAMTARRWLFESRRWGESDFPSPLYNPIKSSSEDI
jgi:hypothetical protein